MYVSDLINFLVSIIIFMFVGVSISETYLQILKVESSHRHVIYDQLAETYKNNIVVYLLIRTKLAYSFELERDFILLVLLNVFIVFPAVIVMLMLMYMMTRIIIFEDLIYKVINSVYLLVLILLILNLLFYLGYIKNTVEASRL